MSAFRGKADMTFCECLLLWSLLGVMRTSLVAAHMSANDPKRTSETASDHPFQYASFSRYDGQSLVSRGGNEAARVHQPYRRRGGVATHSPCATASDAGYWVSQTYEG